MLRKRGIFAQYSHVSLSKAIDEITKLLPNGRRDFHSSVRGYILDIYGKLCPNNERYFLDKTPRYYLILDEIAAIFPEARFIFLFRNPLAVLSSLIKSFFHGRLGDYRHKIDFIKGPSQLAEGYRRLKKRSIAIKYERLVQLPDLTLKQICDYLTLPFTQNMIEDFTDISFKGKMGDQYGSTMYQKVDSTSLDLWRMELATALRKRYAKKYLRRIGRDTVETFGYDYQDLIAELETLPGPSRDLLRDIFDLSVCTFWTFFEVPMFRKIFEDTVKKGREPFIHI